MQSKVFRQFLLSNLAVLFVPLSLGLVVQYRSASAITDEAHQATLAVVRGGRELLDSRLEAVGDLARQISLNRQVQRYAGLADGLQNTAVQLAAEILEDFGEYRAARDLAAEFYVHFRKSDTILTSTSKYPTELFYAGAYSFDGLGLQQWRELMFGSVAAGAFVPGFTRELSAGGEGGAYLTFRRTLSVGEDGLPEATAVILVDTASVTSLLEGIAGNGRAYIIDRSYGSVLGSRPGGDQPPLWSALPLGHGLVEDRSGSDRRMIIYAASEVLDWKYAAVVPRRLYATGLDEVRSATTVAYAAALLFGAVACWLAARRSYHPIRDLWAKVALHAGRAAAKPRDELELISRTLLRTLREERVLQARLREHRSLVRANVLLRLLKGRPERDLLDGDTLASCGIEPRSDRFAVALFRIGEGAARPLRSSGEDRALVSLVMTQLMEEKAGGEGAGYAVETENGVFALLYCGAPGAGAEDGAAGCGEAEAAALRRAAESVAAEMQSRCGAGLTVGIGRFHGGRENIGLAYRDALAVLNYLSVRGRGSMLAYEDLSGGENEFYYPINVEKDLHNFVVTGDWKNASALIDYIVRENFENRKLSFRLLQIMFFELMGTAVKTLQQIRVDHSEIFGPGFDPLERLLRCQSVEEIRGAVMETYAAICSFVDGHRRVRNERLRQGILGAIERRLADRGLSQTLLAEELGITPSYLSYFFKEQFGENMVDYVNRLRVSRAKELFDKDPARPISAVADLVGCGSDKALIRIFKRYEGVTPGRYRDTYPAVAAAAVTP